MHGHPLEIAPAHHSLPDSFFQPASVAGLQLRTRWVMSPMASRSHGNFLANADYFAERAANGVGLIITGGIVIDHPFSGFQDQADYPRFTSSQEQRLRRIPQAVHAAGGLISAQVWHLGGQVPGGIAARPRTKNGKETAREVRDDELQVLVEAYARACAMAKAVGFDGVELHGAHGYLLDGFLRRWGTWDGSPCPASRFAVEVIRACRAAVGAEYPIGLRFSQWNVDDYEARYLHSWRDMERFLEPLVRAGIDLFHASTRRFWVPAFAGSPLSFAGWARRLSGKPVIAVGGFGTDHPGGPGKEETFRHAARMLGEGECDLMALGRPLLSDAAYCAPRALT